MKKFIAALALVVASIGLIASPAQAHREWDAKPVASVPDWDARLTYKTPTQWAAISTVLDSPEDLAYARNLPASPLAALAKAQSDCNGVSVVCLWNGYSYTGIVWQLPNSWMIQSQVGDGNGLSFYGSYINNVSKGWWNKTPNRIVLYDRDDCQNVGFTRDMTSGQTAVQAGAGDADWENIFSSASMAVVRGNYCYSDPYQ